MADLIWVPNPPDVAKILQQVPVLGVPAKVNREWLKSIGFKSSNHAYLPPILGKLGFIDASNAPTDRWKSYRDKSRQKAIMGVAVREAYRELFTTYPDAQNRDAEALRNFFGSRSNASDITLQRAVGTFKALVVLADFDATATDSPQPTPFTGGPQATARVTAPSASALGSINLNIELHLPATDDSAVYEKLFAAMKKHLLE